MTILLIIATILFVIWMLSLLSKFNAFAAKGEFSELLDKSSQLIAAYGFDESTLVPIQQMITEATKAKQPLPDKDVPKLAHICVFNSVAQSLMQHQFNLSDSALTLSGEMHLAGLKRLGAKMVSLNYVSQAEMQELLDNIINVTFEFAASQIRAKYKE